ncbi:GNAT family N-acetyltransferase [Aquimarina hainanensis]|uniref:GNAT family N-acetyltransferase n=1 Tax=Aquimarina hainanensis TaxID=1578017 RepID=A0ABW5N370_9FLAO|nr:GNAT family N-acetyltransferase [Aquimarina sp. TRL1]QKX04675.1 GNAT family N-acetyltransferase [Aquimarina sp. TRL1]
MSGIHFEVRNFDQLSTTVLYDILRLRAEVFVVEQDCVYQDLDGKDRNALHVIGYKDEKIVAYTRLFDSGAYFDEATSLGRVVVAENERKHKYGHDLIIASIKAIEEHYHTSKIKISAQKYLINFYKKHGFSVVGDEYLEDGIPHVAMIRD